MHTHTEIDSSSAQSSRIVTIFVARLAVTVTQKHLGTVLLCRSLVLAVQLRTQPLDPSTDTTSQVSYGCF